LLTELWKVNGVRFAGSTTPCGTGSVVGVIARCLTLAVVGGVTRRYRGDEHRGVGSAVVAPVSEHGRLLAPSQLP